MLSQNLLNVVDTWFVSRLGDAAIGAVGQGSFANFMSLAFITGLSPGVQAMAARREGEGHHDQTGVALNGGILLALAFGLPIGALVYSFAPLFFPILAGDNAAVAELGTEYLQIRLLAVPAVGINFAFRGYWNAIDQSQVYLRTLIVMHVVNIALDAVLIFGLLGAPTLGVAGAAWASMVATYVGTFYYFIQGWARARDAGFLAAVPPLRTLTAMLRTSLPSALQQFLFAAGLTVFFAIVARLGEPELAASTVLITLLLVAILPAQGFGLASASLVGQALGRGDGADARRWAWDVIKVAVIVVGAIAAVGFVGSDLILAGFLESSTTRALARWPMRLVALSLPFDVVGMVLLNSLLGAGDSMRVLVVSTSMQWLVFLPMALIAGPLLGLGLTAVWGANVAYRLIQSGIFAAIWQGESWTKVEL